MARRASEFDLFSAGDHDSLCHSLHRRNLAGTRLALKIYPPLEIFTAKMEVEGKVEWTSGFHIAS